jgi:hypothetical protein
MGWNLYTHKPDGIFEVNLKNRGVLIHALDVRFPEQESKITKADEHNDDLKKYC